MQSVAGSGGAAAEIEKAKSLLDSGAITQAEFEEAQGRGARVAPQREAVCGVTDGFDLPITDRSARNRRATGRRGGSRSRPLPARSCSSSRRFPASVQVFGSAAAGTAFFAGSVPFTVAAVIQCAVTYRAEASRPIDWCSSIVLLAGTVFFNVNTFRAARTGFDHPE